MSETRTVVVQVGGDAIIEMDVPTGQHTAGLYAANIESGFFVELDRSLVEEMQLPTGGVVLVMKSAKSKPAVKAKADPAPTDDE